MRQMLGPGARCAIRAVLLPAVRPCLLCYRNPILCRAGPRRLVGFCLSGLGRSGLWDGRQAERDGDGGQIPAMQRPPPLIHCSRNVAI